MALEERDAEQAKSTGGMIALLPRRDFTEALAIPGGEPLSDIHLTLAYLGQDITGLTCKDDMVKAMSTIAGSIHAVLARVFGHATFNPDGGPDGDMDPCSVYLVSDCASLGPLRDSVQEACAKLIDLPNQHNPFIPHITAGYTICDLTFTGKIIFDRLSLHWAGDEIDFPLTESSVDRALRTVRALG